MNDPLILFFAAASASGAVFATVAASLRRGRGPWALLAATVAGIVLLVTVIRRLYVLEAVFVAPAIPALLMEAGVLEWRARRAARKSLWLEVVWGTATFLLTAVVGMVVALAGFRCTGCVG